MKQAADVIRFTSHNLMKPLTADERRYCSIRRASPLRDFREWSPASLVICSQQPAVIDANAQLKCAHIIGESNDVVAIRCRHV